MNVTLIGMGSGQPENLTLQGLAALRQADLILGARRLLAVLPAGCTENRAAAYRPDEVADLLQTSGAENAVLVYSGDTGFYSGASAMMEKLENLGVHAILTFDVHDPTIHNAIPGTSFENIFPTYSMLKCFIANEGANIKKDNMTVISPDTGAMDRAIYYANTLGVDVGMFYKRRDYARVVNGRNPIVAHEYLGESVEGKDVFIADDIIASGESMLDIAYELKMRGARNIFTCCTFPLFTAGLEKFDKAYNDGIIKAVLGTNLTYRKPELLEREWYYDVDVSKYTAYFIAAINHDKSVSSIIDPMTKIRTLLDKHGIPMGGEQ